MNLLSFIAGVLVGSLIVFLNYGHLLELIYRRLKK
jgi:hypothetical protein